MSSTRYPQPDSSATGNVIETVATHEGVDPRELEPPLFSAINTDALNQLFTDTDGTPWDGCVTFSYQGYIVSVSGNKQGSVEPIDAPPDDQR